MMNLNIGCGDVYFEGWVNVDIDSPKADLRHDARTPLPYPDNAVDFIFNEHFIEHITVHEAVNFMRECHRVLKPGGILRMGTPDLNYIMFRHFFFWRRQKWIKQYGYEWVKTNVELININFREWGHQYLYNRKELERRLKEAGFHIVHRVRRGKSKYPELRNKETRAESRLILEATKNV